MDYPRGLNHRDPSKWRQGVRAREGNVIDGAEVRVIRLLTWKREESHEPRSAGSL